MTTSFADLKLSASLLRAIDEEHYQSPMPIQSAAIPKILLGKDVRACAQTGSGKTAAFALPILHKLMQQRSAVNRNVSALILAPTRELAMQIGASFRSFARFAPREITREIRIVTVCGGVSINPQMLALRGGADIIVATPGRLLDLVDHNAVRLGAVETLVLDEADKLLEMGFAKELTRILLLLPPRQTLLFSATFPQPVQVLAEAVLTDPVRIDVESAPSIDPAITHRAIAVDPARRVQLLKHLIEQNGWTRVLVFVATKYATEHVAKKLRSASISAASLHGELSQAARTQALADFKASKSRVLVATDIAARGIDIVQLPVVVNFDLPRSAVDYTHRAGRTARAGEEGLAVSFVSAESEPHFRLIEKRNHFIAPREQIEGFEMRSDTLTQAASALSGGIKSKRKRKSKKDK